MTIIRRSKDGPEALALRLPGMDSAVSESAKYDRLHTLRSRTDGSKATTFEPVEYEGFLKSR